MAGVPAPAQKLLDFIASFEAPRGYDTVYGNKMARMAKRLSTMTIDEVIQNGPWRTRNFGSSAAGKYQFMTDTLKSLKQSLRLSGSEVMSPPFQDRLGYELLRRRGYARYMSGSLSLTAFGLAIAQEWASFPVLAAVQGQKRRVQRGQSYYSGDGLNHVLVGADEVQDVLRSLRSEAVVAVADPDAVSFPRVAAISAPIGPALPWWGRLLGIKAKDQPGKRPGLAPNGDPALWDVQKALRDKAYYTKGFLDGLDGGITQSAVAQARKDNDLGDGGIDADFLAILPTMPNRPVSPERASLSVKEAAKHAPELFNPAKLLGGLGMGAVGLGGANGSGLLDSVQSTASQASDVFGSVQTVFGYAGTAVAFVVEHRTWFLIGLGLFLLIKAAGYVLDAWVKVRAAFF